MRPRSACLLSFVVLVGCGDNLSGSVDARPADARIDTPPDGPDCVPSPQRPQLEALTTGELVIPAADKEATAEMTPVLDRSILFVTMREDESSPRHGAVLCELRPADVPNNILAGVNCRRQTAGTDQTGSTGEIHVRWTVATFSSGVTVQRGIIDTNPPSANPVMVALSAIDPTKSFVLSTGVFQSGGGWGSNEFANLQLLDGTTLQVKHTTAGSAVAWQVVTMTGATVQRGTTTLATADVDKTVAITAVPDEHLALVSYNTDNTSSIEAASLMLSVRATTDQLVLHRELGGAVLDVAYEIISLPFATHSGTTSFAIGETSKAEPVANAAPATTVTIGSSQAILGASSGTTAFADATILDLVGEAAATMTTAAGSVTLQRDTSVSAATIPWTAIDFARDCGN